MQVTSLQQLMQGGEQPSEQQMAALQAHADAVHARSHEVDTEIREQLLFWAPVLCSCSRTYKPFTLASPPSMAECLIHGQAATLLGPQPECEHDG